MRTRMTSMVAAVLLRPAGGMAQTSQTSSTQPDVPKAAAASSPDIPLVNQIDFGVRGTAFGAGSDQARFERYEDLRDGATIDVFRMFKDTEQSRYSLQADHVGYRDQRFSASYNNFGKVKASFEWNQIPLFYSQTTSTLYTVNTDAERWPAASIGIRTRR